MGYMQLRENCVFQTLKHYKNYIFEIFCLQQAYLLDSFQNECIKNDNIPWAGFLSHFATSCDIVTWALQDEVSHLTSQNFNLTWL